MQVFFICIITKKIYIYILNVFVKLPKTLRYINIFVYLFSYYQAKIHALREAGRVDIILFLSRQVFNQYLNGWRQPREDLWFKWPLFSGRALFQSTITIIYQWQSWSANWSLASKNIEAPEKWDYFKGPSLVRSSNIRLLKERVTKGIFWVMIIFSRQSLYSEYMGKVNPHKKNVGGIKPGLLSISIFFGVTSVVCLIVGGWISLNIEEWATVMDKFLKFR